MLYTLLQHGVETTVDRSSKNTRIMKWIKQGAERSQENISLVEQEEEETIDDNIVEDLEDLDIERVSPE